MIINIERKKIGKNKPVFLIAEAGVNHNGSYEIGKKLIDVAVASGADAVKFQTFKADNIIIPKGPKAKYHLETTGSNSKLSWFELLKTQEISREMHIKLINYCKRKKIIFLSTPYDNESADLLDELGVSAFKIASTDNDNFPFLKYVAKKNKPIIVSTAMSNFHEVIEAEKTIKKTGNKQYAILQCTGNYPSKIEDSNIEVIESYINKFKCPIGYSDHTMSELSSIMAVAKGAKIVEKHFTINQKLFGPDHRMSANPKQLKDFFKKIRLAELALGDGEKKVLKNERANRLKLKKSLVTSRDILKGTTIKLSDIEIKRPGNGIRPIDLSKYINKKIKYNLKKNIVLKSKMFK